MQIRYRIKLLEQVSGFVHFHFRNLWQVNLELPCILPPAFLVEMKINSLLLANGVKNQCLCSWQYELTK